MQRIIVYPYDDDSPLPESDRQVFASLLSRIFDELPNTRKTWCATLALGLPRCIGMSVADMARLAKCTDAELVHGAVQFAASINVKASPNLRGAVAAYLASGELTVTQEPPKPASKA